MADTMTRAQAVCACRNIIALAEVTDNAPDEFTGGVQERAASMEMGMISKPQYPRVTENMDRAIRNMWAGLRKWDRDEKHDGDLFDDLSSVEAELADLDASANNVPLPKGREDTSQHAALTGAPPAANVGVANDATAALRRKEALVSRIYETIDTAPISVVDKKNLRGMNLSDVLRLTKGDRTRQLLHAAYYVGVLRGVWLLNGALRGDNDAQVDDAGAS